MLFNILPQVIIILALAAILYIILRKDDRILEKEKKLAIRAKKILELIKGIDYKKYLNIVKSKYKIAKLKIPKPKKKLKLKPKKSPVTKMISEQKYIDMISENPRNITAYLKLGQLYKEQKNHTDAKGCFVQILRIEPNNQEAKKELENLSK